MGFGTAGFGAGGIGDDVVSRDKLTDDAAARVGLFNDTSTTKTKTIISSFDSNAIDTARWTSTVSSGTNTATTNYNGGFIRSSTTTTAGRSAKMVSVCQIQGNTTTTVFEFYCKLSTFNATTAGKVSIGIGATIDGTAAVNTAGLGFQITGAADDWAFYTVKSDGTVEKDTALTGIGDTAWHVVSIITRGASGDPANSVQCYIDGVQVGTTHTTSIPTLTTQFYWGWWVSNETDAAANVLDVKQVRVTQYSP